MNTSGRRGSIRPQVKQAANMLRQIAREFVKDQCSREANAMAYRTLFSAVPMLAVFLSVFTLFDAFEAFQDRILSMAYQFLAPGADEIVREHLLSFAENTKTLGAVGFLGTILAALYLFWAIERSFNNVWEVDQRRGFVRKFTAFTALLLWTPIFLGLSFYLTGKLQFYMPRFLEPVVPSITGWASLRFLPVLFSFLGLTTMYIVVPNTRVMPRAAAFGGMVAAVGWELVKVGFNFYVARAVGYSKVYGSLAVIPIFIVGLFLLWLVVFIGLEITYVFHSYRYHQTWDEREWSGMKPYLAVGVMLEMGRRFNENCKPPTVIDLARFFRVAIPLLFEVMKSLEAGGLLVRVDEDTFYISRSLKFITLKDVVAAGVGEVGAIDRMSENFGGLIQGLPARTVAKIHDIFKEVAEEHERVLGGMNLDELLQNVQFSAEKTPVAGAGVSG